MILTMFRRCALLAGLASLALPASALGACAAQDPGTYADHVPLVFLARALDGERVNGGGPLLSPARFAVVAYEKGSGPDERLVDTGYTRSSGVSEGIGARPGELWRLFGVVRDGIVETGTCFGSHPVGALRAPVLRVAGRTLTPRPSTLAGRTALRAPRVRVRRAVVTVRSNVPLASVRIAGAALAPHDASRMRWTVRVPRGASRLVVDTGDRAYTGAFSRLAHR